MPLLCSLCCTVLCCLACFRLPAQETPKGLWLLPRKDPQNSARADVPGNIKRIASEHRIAERRVHRTAG